MMHPKKKHCAGMNHLQFAKASVRGAAARSDEGMQTGVLDLALEHEQEVRRAESVRLEELRRVYASFPWDAVRALKDWVSTARDQLLQVERGTDTLGTRQQVSSVLAIWQLTDTYVSATERSTATPVTAAFDRVWDDINEGIVHNRWCIRGHQVYALIGTWGVALPRSLEAVVQELLEDSEDGPCVPPLEVETLATQVSDRIRVLGLTLEIDTASIAFPNGMLMLGHGGAVSWRTALPASVVEDGAHTRSPRVRFPDPINVTTGFAKLAWSASEAGLEDTWLDFLGAAIVPPHLRRGDSRPVFLLDIRDRMVPPGPLPAAILALGGLAVTSDLRDVAAFPCSPQFSPYILHLDRREAVVTDQDAEAMEEALRTRMVVVLTATAPPHILFQRSSPVLRLSAVQVTDSNPVHYSSSPAVGPPTLTLWPGMRTGGIPQLLAHAYARTVEVARAQSGGILTFLAPEQARLQYRLNYEGAPTGTSTLLMEMFQAEWGVQFLEGGTAPFDAVSRAAQEYHCARSKDQCRIVCGDVDVLDAATAYRAAFGHLCVLPVVVWKPSTRVFLGLSMRARSK